MSIKKNFDEWANKQVERGINVDNVLRELDNFDVETPSWAFGDSGTRFNTYKKIGGPRNLFERIDDCAQVKKYTGTSSTMCLHIPWDKVEDFGAVKEYGRKKGINFGAVNPNLFQDDEYMLGSISHSDSSVREKAIDRINESIDVAKMIGSNAVNVWLTDGSNMPGQNDIRRRKNWIFEGLKECYNNLGDDVTMYLEYKLFEPSFYHTDICDWGTSYMYCLKLGEKAKVTVDLGHHALGVNVPQIIANLLDEKKLGCIHINDNMCGDDDLVAGSVNPYRLFLIYNEVVAALFDAKLREYTKKVANAIDQSFCIEEKIPAMIISVLNVQETFAKALLVNRDKLKAYQENGDILRANQCVKQAFAIDISPLLAYWRDSNGIPANPYEAYMESGYANKIAERGYGKGWN